MKINIKEMTLTKRIVSSIKGELILRIKYFEKRWKKKNVGIDITAIVNANWYISSIIKRALNIYPTIIFEKVPSKFL